ncbi:lysozyme [Azoarcus indigens]|uniref:Lysozyme n=2 Tax=Azoarcus indigens TaxID=29545 RepID=A0A4R6DVC0_9RHOO|nr:lysozyme [Azoarcus indigens]
MIGGGMEKTMSKARIAVAALSLSAVGFVGIALKEDYRGTAYVPVKGDVPTIGFGSTKGVQMGDTITPPKALTWAMRDVQTFEGDLKRCVAVPLFQHEYDAYVSFAYNVGGGAFCGSTLVRKLNAGDYEGACGELRRWVYSGGRKVQGLVNRREQEYQACMGLSRAEGGR